jgi:small subunit ribosomal protein S3
LPSRRKKLGRKVHPTGFRIGIIRDWQAKWYASKQYVEFLHQDLKLRQAIRSEYADAGISLVEIDRQANRVVVTIHTARPGVVIGRGGQRVDEMRQRLEGLIGNRIQLNIQEIRQPELDAYLVAKAVAEQIERRVAHRRAMKQAIFRTLEAGAKGIRISCAGRLGGAEIARRETMHQGQVPLQKLRADIDYGFAEAHTTLGRIGVKAWIYRGDILPQVVEGEGAEEAPAAPAEEAVKPAPAKLKKKPAEAVAEVEEAPAAPAEEAVKPAPAKLKKKPAEAVAEVEEAPAAPVEEAVKPAPAKLKKKPAEAVAEVEEAPAAPVEEAVKPAPAKLKKKPAKPKRVKKVKDTDSIKSEEQDVTTETGEIPQES